MHIDQAMRIQNMAQTLAPEHFQNIMEFLVGGMPDTVRTYLPEVLTGLLSELMTAENLTDDQKNIVAYVMSGLSHWPADTNICNEQSED